MGVGVRPSGQAGALQQPEPLQTPPTKPTKHPPEAPHPTQQFPPPKLHCVYSLCQIDRPSAMVL